MKQEAKEKIVFALLLFVKLLTALRTGIDTYLVSQDFLNVLLLDVTFLVLWAIFAYTGRGATAMAIRPFAAAGAFFMYGWMMYIGWEAHSDNPAVALAVRSAGLVMLIYDAWDYGVALYQKQQDKLGRTLGEKQRNYRAKVWEEAYKKAVDKTKPSFYQHSLLMLGSDIDGDTDYRESVYVMPPPRKQLPAGLVENERSQNVLGMSKNEKEREIDVSRPSIKRRWDEVYPALADTFTRKDIEEVCKCAKTQAFEIIAYGKHLGLVSETAERGVYQKVTIIEGEVSEPSEQGF